MNESNIQYLEEKYGIQWNESNKYALFDNLTLKQRFEINIGVNELFDPKGDHQYIEFIRGLAYCYHIQDIKIGWFNFAVHKLLNDSQFLRLSLSFKYPDIGFERSQSVAVPPDITRPPLYVIQAYSYTITALEFPYITNCINFTSKGFIDKDDAIEKCKNEILMKEKHMIFSDMLFTRNMTTMFEGYPFYYSFKYPNDTILNVCDEKYEKFSDCFKITIFPTIYVSESPNEKEFPGKIIILKDESNNPSYEINDQPSLSHIEYVTYILGCIGSWIGISFIDMNPLPLLFKKKCDEEFENENCGKNFNIRKQIVAQDRKIRQLQTILLNRNRHVQDTLVITRLLSQFDRSMR